MVKMMGNGLKILAIRHFSSLRTKLMALFTHRAGKHVNLLCQVFSAHKKKLIFPSEMVVDLRDSA